MACQVRSILKTGKLFNVEIDKYLDLRIELPKIWNIKVVVMPVVISALGTMLKRIQIEISINQYTSW